MTKKKFSSARFGPRYGTTSRKTVAEIEAVQKRPHECPSCNYVKVKRNSIGIWACDKCGLKFAGGAWDPKGTQVSVFSTAKERMLEEEAEFEKIFQDKQAKDVDNEREEKRKSRERNVAIIVEDSETKDSEEAETETAQSADEAESLPDESVIQDDEQR